MRRRLAIALFLCLLPALAPGMIQAQTPAVQSAAEFLAPEWVTFTAEVESDQEIKSAVVFFQAESDPHTSIGEGDIRALDDGRFGFSYTHMMDDYFIRPFSNVDFHWEWVTADGEKHQSESNQFFYEDNRFEWNMVEGAPFRLHWYEGDLVFAVSVLNAALKGFDQAQRYLPIPEPNVLDIYIYPDSATLQELLGPQSSEWVAGHADPDIGVIVAALPPGPDQALLVKQRIPHELMHILLHRYMQRGYDNLPNWLSEGLASLVELYPNSDYTILLDKAVHTQSLIPMSELCYPFPNDAATALQAYAQSASFTRYVHSVYGTTGIDALVTTYANGLDCERGFQRALGRSLPQIERKWRSEALAEDVNATALNNLLPWMLLLGVVLAPLLLAVVWRLRR